MYLQVGSHKVVAAGLQGSGAISMVDNKYVCRVGIWNEKCFPLGLLALKQYQEPTPSHSEI